METEKTFFVNNDFDDISFAELAENDLDLMHEIVEINRYLNEIRNLFLIFIFNLKELQNNYTLMSSGKIYRSDNSLPADEDTDFIAINAHATNIMSSGKTLVEAMNNFMTIGSFSNNDAQKHKLFCSDIYDHCFAYRLMIRMRDYAQHGHISLCKDGFHYAYNLKSILDQPHFNHNKTLREEMEAITHLIMDSRKTLLTFSFSMIVAEFVVSLISIYRNFLSLIEPTVVKLDDEIDKICETYPENIIPNTLNFSGCFIYEIVEGSAQALFLKSSLRESIDRIKRECESIYRDYDSAWSYLRQGVVMQKIIPNDQ